MKPSLNFKDSMPEKWSFTKFLSTADHIDMVLCHAYEYAATCNHFCKIKNLPKTFDDRFKICIKSFESDFQIMPPFYWLWPEFPNTPYLSIPLDIRKKRFSKSVYSYDEGGLQLVSPLEIHLHYKSLQKTSISKLNSTLENYVCLKINWLTNSNQLKNQFFNLIEELRKNDPRKNEAETRGKKKNINQIKQELKDLGAFRLKQIIQSSKSNIEKSIEKISPKINPPEPFLQDPAYFSKRAKKGGNLIKDFLKSEYFFIKNIEFISDL